MDRRPPASLSTVADTDVSATDAFIEAENLGATHRAMAWLGMYIPTWGTSLTLHIAVLLLAAFWAWGPPQIVNGGYDPGTMIQPVPVPKHPVEHRKRPDVLRETRGHLKPQECSFVKQPLDKWAPGVGKDRAPADIPVIGIGSNPPGGGTEGLGPIGGSDIFPPPETGKVLYVVDRSGSMTDSLDIVKMELKRSLGELDEKAEFHVIFYSTGPAIEMPTRRLVAATERNKQLAYEFIDGVIAQGGTDPTQALERAFAARPQQIYLLTDGEFDRQIIGLVKRLNAGVRARVDTIGFLYTSGKDILKDIAQQNDGQYRFISERDLEAIGRW